MRTGRSMYTYRKVLLDVAVVSCACTSYFVTGSIVANIGALTVEFVREFDATRLQAASVGSLNNGFAFGFSVVAVTLLEQVGYQLPMLVACPMMAILAITAAMVPSLAAIRLIFIMIGTAMSISMTGFTAIVGERFCNRRQRAIAIGVIHMGSATGALILSVLTGWTASRYGYAGILFLFASLGGMGTLSASIYFLILLPAERRFSKISKHVILVSEVDGEKALLTCPEKQDVIRAEPQMECRQNVFMEYASLFGDVRLILITVAYMLAHAALVVVTLLGEDLLVTVFDVSVKEAEYLLIAYTVGGFFGRIAGMACNYLNCSHIKIVTALLALSGVAESVFPFIGFIPVCVSAGFVGFTFGFLVCVMVQIMIDIFGSERLPQYIGIMFTTNGFGAAVGGPIAGLIKDNYSYKEAFYFGGSCMIISSILYGIVIVHSVARGLSPKNIG